MFGGWWPGERGVTGSPLEGVAAYEVRREGKAFPLQRKSGHYSKRAMTALVEFPGQVFSDPISEKHRHQKHLLDRLKLCVFGKTILLRPKPTIQPLTAQESN